MIRSVFLFAIPSLLLAANVGRYEEFGLTLPVDALYSNPYDPDIVDVQEEFAAPSGKTLRLPVRFAPAEIGTYRYKVTLKDQSGTRGLTTGPVARSR